MAAILDFQACILKIVELKNRSFKINKIAYHNQQNILWTELLLAMQEKRGVIQLLINYCVVMYI